MDKYGTTLSGPSLRAQSKEMLRKSKYEQWERVPVAMRPNGPMKLAYLPSEALFNCFGRGKKSLARIKALKSILPIKKYRVWLNPWFLNYVKDVGLQDKLSQAPWFLTTQHDKRFLHWGTYADPAYTSHRSHLWAVSRPHLERSFETARESYTT